MAISYIGTAKPGEIEFCLQLLHASLDLSIHISAIQDVVHTGSLKNIILRDISKPHICSYS